MSLFGTRKKRPTPPKPAGPVRIHCTLSGDVKDPLAIVVDGVDTAFVAVLESPTRATFTIPGDVPKWGFWYHYGNRSLRAVNADGSDMPLPPAGDHEGPVLDFVPAKPPVEHLGPVSLNGRTWMSKNGPFFPLASTLFWAVGGVKQGQVDRVRDNFRFLYENGCHAVRILAQVKWDGEIGNADERWPDYADVLGQTIDVAAEEGLLVKLTCIGGGVRDLRLLADKLCQVLPARREKLLMVEGVNEGNASVEDVQYLFGRLMPLLPGVPWAPGFGDQSQKDNPKHPQTVGALMNSPVDVLHVERELGVNDEPGGPHARQARQGWNFADRRKAQDWGEPPGPESSVAQLDDPDILAAAYATSIISGAGSGCAHFGSGVFGKDYDSQHGHRYANLREHPKAVAVFRAMTTAAEQLWSFAPDICNWRPFNNPLIVERVNISSSEGLGRGQCNKIYGARAGTQFVEIILGCDPVIRLLGAPGSVFVVTDTATGREVARGRGGEVVQVSGCWSYLVIGTA